MKVGVRRESDGAELVGVVANEKGSFGFQLRGRGRIVHFVKGGHRHSLSCAHKRGKVGGGFGRENKLVNNLDKAPCYIWVKKFFFWFFFNSGSIFSQSTLINRLLQVLI